MNLDLFVPPLLATAFLSAQIVQVAARVEYFEEIVTKDIARVNGVTSGRDRSGQRGARVQFGMRKFGGRFSARGSVEVPSANRPVLGEFGRSKSTIK